jgi:DNA topoisomerase-3
MDASVTSMPCLLAQLHLPDPNTLSKQLIIAEKPSVAADIARALGGFTRHGDYFESDQFVLSSAVGHLLEIGMPEEEEVKRGKWTFAHLPAIPSHFELKPIEKNEARLRTVLKLIKRKDVTRLINACDAGREGELIFRYIVQYANADKPIERLWLQSMTPASIRDGFARLRSDQSLRPLADAAVCRSESDWLVGINGTRAMTAFNSKSGGFQLTTVGRVQTPTLAILVEREAKIRAFVPRNYWELVGTFRAEAGEYTGRWFDETFRKRDGATNAAGEAIDDADLRPERLWDEAAARAIAQACAGRPGIVTEEAKPTTQIAPLLYDLTSLQREANGRFGFSARTTLSLAQSLYEKHKALTYPRTDSRALPEDYIGTVKATLDELAQTNAYGTFARRILKSQWVRPNKRIFDNAKISDHFAIIPTLVQPRHLNEIETKLYDLVVRRFLAVFHPAAEFLVTTRITRVGDHPFKSEGKVLVQPGWLAVYGKEAAGEEPTLTPVKVREVVDTAGGASPAEARTSATRRYEGTETVATDNVDVVAQTTRPPARFNEATLLSAMEGAGKLIEDDELREAMREKGLGTPATRAQIIEGLITERYILREGKELIPTAKAFSLVTLLHGLGIPELFSPELTAGWEFKLAQMEHGALKRSEFMREIVGMTKHIVAQAKNYESDTVPGDFATLKTRCPRCGGEVHERYKKFQCIECDFGFWKIMGGRQIEPAEAEALLSAREVGPLDGFRSRIGRPFSAKLKLTDANEVEFDFGPRLEDEDGPAPDFSGQTPLGPCPKCGNRVFETPNAYVCERAVGEGRTCDFRSGRTILQRPIDRAQMSKLLETGKTDLLQFVSARTRRPFSAYLVKQADGKVGFEFEAKEPGRRGARPVRSAPLRVLGTHPRDRQPVELHAGRYGPYVKHGTTNATLPDRDAVDSLSLEQAVALVDEKAGRAPAGARRRTVKTRAPRTSPPAVESTAAAKRRAPARGARVVEAPSEAKAKATTPRATAAATARSTKRGTAVKTSAPATRVSAAASKAKPSAARTTAAKKTTVSASRRTAGAKTTPVASRSTAGAKTTPSATRRTGTKTAAGTQRVARSGNGTGAAGKASAPAAKRKPAGRAVAGKTRRR